ncbi:MAG TPA: FecR family protein, partial [Terriglobales bacterium]|nr:FecR family protein [Terriglobales bacterium]
VAAIVCCLFPVAAFAGSNVRIVRLSDVQGTVQIDRATGQGLEKAFLNMPITQGVKLKSGDDGRAEVEFEDNSIIHVVPNTELQFTDLSLSDSGVKISSVDLGKGQAYVNFMGKKDDEFTVTFAHEKTTLTHAAHFRLRVDQDSAELAVFDGDVQVNGPTGEVKLSKKQTATFDLADDDKYEVAKKVQEDPFDAWDKHQAEYHQRYEASNSYGSPYSYGYSDLNYYGNYMNYPGCGMCWQPYFTGMGWNPYMDGAWMLYPGFGYSWVSAYPWGWTPYHYGSWMFLPAHGWVWQPGNSWLAWNAVPPVLNAPRNYIPPRPPRIGPSVVAVGRGPMTSSLAGTRPGSKLILNRPTAGIGIPRGIDNLGRVNRDFETRGQARVGVPGGMRGAAMTAAPTPTPRMGSMGGDRVGNMSPRMSMPSGRTSSAGSHSSSGAAPHK